MVLARSQKGEFRGSGLFVLSGGVTDNAASLSSSWGGNTVIDRPKRGRTDCPRFGRFIGAGKCNSGRSGKRRSATRRLGVSSSDNSSSELDGLRAGPEAMKVVGRENMSKEPCLGIGRTRGEVEPELAVTGVGAVKN